MPIARAGTEVDAINLSLSLLREEEIADITEDTKPAREARKWFGTARDETLRAHEWNFAEAWAAPPAADPATYPGPLGKMFPLPADCVKVRYVEGLSIDEWKVVTVPLGAPPPVETSVLVTNAAAPAICYTRRIFDVALWDAQFIVAFTRRLAGYMAPSFGKSFDESDAIEGSGQRKVDAAAKQDARERAPTHMATDVPFTRARRGWRRPW